MFATKLDKAVMSLAIAGSGRENEADRNKALSAIYDLMARTILSTAHAITGNFHDAEDVLQDTFLKISANASKFTGTGAKTWILTISKHLAIDMLRKQSKTVSFDEPNFAESRLAAVNDDYSGLAIFALLGSLDEDERQIVTYRVYAKMPYKEIAKVMDVSASYAQKKYQRAIKKLRKEHSHENYEKTETAHERVGFNPNA